MLKGYTKAEKSWMLYDWANSAFATIIAAIILPIFFKEIAHQNGVSDVDATAFWGYATSCGTLICAVLAAIIALAVVGALKGQLKQAAQQSAAGGYIRDGSFRLDMNADHFLYESTTKRKIENNTQKK